MTGQPPLEEPTAEEPTAEEPTAEEPTPEEPTPEEPTPERGLPHADPPERVPWRRRLAGLRRFSWLWPWIGLGWMIGVLLVGLPMVARIAGEPLLGEAYRTFWSEDFVRAAALTYAVVLVPSLLAWLLRRDLALPIGLVAALAVVLTVADNTDALPALAIVGVQTLLAWFIGMGLVSLVIRPGAAGVSLLARTVIAFAVGNGSLGLAYLGLGSFGRIEGTSIVLLSVGLVIASAVILLVRGRRELRLPELYSPSLLETLVFAGALAFATWALLHAYVPEVLSDAVRHHLPITREIWQTGSAPEFVWWTSWYPIHAQLVTVPAWAVGGMAGVSLSHGVVGLAAGLGAAALAQALAGQRAAAVAFAAFVSLPLVLWELGHSYVDLYPALFVVTGAAAVVLWQRLGPMRILVLAGFLAGLAFASKTTAAPGVAALGVAVLLVGRERFSLWSRLAAGIAVAAGGLIIAPWLWRSYQITGQFPGLDLLFSTVLGTERDRSVDLASFGLGRSPLDLAAIPGAATFQGELFGQNGAGALGLLLLMAVPLVVFAPRTRSLAFALVLVGMGALAWAFTAQYLRYSLPLASVLAALAGVGVSSLSEAFGRRGPRFMGTVVMVIAIVAIALAPLLSLPARRNQVPFEFYTGEMDGEPIVLKHIGGYEMLQAANDLVGEDEPLLWLGDYFGGIYTDAHGAEVRPRELGTRDAEILQALEERDIEYFGWQLDGTDPREFGLRIVSPAFLRDHSELVATVGHTYLFRIGEELGWDQGPQLLPPIEAVGPDEDWVPRGEPAVTDDGVSIPRGGNIKATAPVEAGSTYVVRVRGGCEDGGAVIVFILWKNEDSLTVGRDRQRVSLPQRGPTFILTTAVEGAESAVVHVSPLLTECTIASTTMRQLVNAPEAQ